MLAVSAILFYVFVYTMVLKRSSPQNIVIGGAAGAVPVLVGWAAVTGRVEVPALMLFAIVFIWTPPHFWALAMKFERDYREAGVPMLPVVAGMKATQRQILLYSLVLFLATLAFAPVGRMGTVYLASALARGDEHVPLLDHLSRAPVRGDGDRSSRGVTGARSNTDSNTGVDLREQAHERPRRTLVGGRAVW